MHRQTGALSHLIFPITAFFEEKSILPLKFLEGPAAHVTVGGVQPRGSV